MPVASSHHVIEVEGLTKHFGPLRAVDELSFGVPSGTVVGFLGPNGSGKTTTLRMLLDLIRPTAGRALIEGRPYRELSDPVSKVGAALEATALHPGRSGRAHLRILARQARIPRSRVDEVIELVGLEAAANRRAAGYSLGMRQRLALAGALLGDPGIVLLDEPANGLDPEGVRWLRELLRRLAAEGRTVLVSSHVLAEVAQTVDSVVIIGHGRLIAQGTLDELGANAAHQVHIRTPQTDDLLAVLRRHGHQAQRVDGELVSVVGANARTVGELIAEHEITVYELAEDRATLEDLFLELTADAESIR